MGGVTDWLFGDQESTKGIKFQRDANQRVQEFAQESTGAARQDLLDIFPRAQESAQQASRAAIDVARKGPQSQIRALSRAGTNAQKALMGGMAAYQNAIMGTPTGIVSENFGQNPAGLRPVAIGMSEFVQAGRPFHGSQQPHFLGTQKRDWEEFKMRKDNPDDFWGLARPEKAPNLFPEQYRGGVMYDYDARQAGVAGRPAVEDYYGAALSGGVPDLTWSGR
jgi:hypothetical protein